MFRAFFLFPFFFFLSGFRNTGHGWPMLKFSKIPMLTKKNFLVTVALESSLSLESFFGPEKIASRNLISYFIKTSIMKFCDWFAENIYDGLAAMLQIMSASEFIMLSDSVLCFRKKKVFKKYISILSVYIENSQCHFVNMFYLLLTFS